MGQVQMSTDTTTNLTRDVGRSVEAVTVNFESGRCHYTGAGCDT